MLRFLGIAALLAVLAACGGLGTTALTARFVSHTDGEVITGNRVVTLTGTLSGGSTISSVSVSRNGAEVTSTFDQTGFSADITLADNTNTVEVTVTDSSGKSASDSIELIYPFLSLTDFQAASVVIGQPDFVSNGSSTPTATNFAGLYGNPYVHDGVLYAPDYSNHRVLGFNTVPTTNGASADFVLGQPDLNTNTDGESGSADLYGPQTAFVYDSKLFVTEYDNNRILIWNSAPTTTEAPADIVVGQSGFGASASDCAASSLNRPESFVVVDGKLIVADSGNNRVLIWSTIPTVSGQPADLVLGQDSFTECLENDKDHDNTADPASGPSATTLFYPTDVWSDGELLIVADASNNRVLIWTNFPMTDAEPADLVLGQPDMTTANTGTTDQDLNFPYFLTSNGNQLFVNDTNNNRIMIWDGIPTTDYAPADRVIGQSTFTNGASNDKNQDNTDDTDGPNASTLSSPQGLFVFDDKLIVADYDNNRYLIFEAP